MECFEKISDGSLSDVTLPENSIKIEDENKSKIEHENYVNGGTENDDSCSENEENSDFDENSKISGAEADSKRVRWVKSIRGKDKAFFRGYCYTRNRANKDTISWSCEDISRHKCPGRIQTKGDKVVKILNKHTHDEKPVKETIYQVSSFLNKNKRNFVP